MGRATGGERRGAEVEFDGVQFQLRRRFGDVDVDLDSPAKDALSKFGVMKIR